MYEDVVCLMSSIAFSPSFYTFRNAQCGAALATLSWLSIAAPAGTAKVSQGTTVSNDPHTWPVDGNETPPLHSGISRCCPVPYYLDGYAFCHRVNLRDNRVGHFCCADTMTLPSSILFGSPPPALSVLCPSRALRWHISTQYVRPPLLSTSS